MFLKGRNDSVVKSIGYSFRRPRFNTQHPHGGSQLAVTGVPVGDLTPAEFGSMCL